MQNNPFENARNTYEYLTIRALLDRNDLWDLVCGKLKQDLITNDYLKKVFSVVYDKLSNGLSVDSFVVAKEAQLDVKDTFSYFNNTEHQSAFMQIENYVDMLVAFKKSDKLNELKSISSDLPFDEQVKIINKIVDDADDLSFNDDDVFSISDFSNEVIQNLENHYRGEIDSSIIKTSFSGVDNKIDGFKGGELIVIAGRPAMGKTAFAMNCAFNMAKSGKNVLIFSLEMSKRELLERAFSSECMFNVRSQVKDFNKIINSKNYLDNLPISISDKASMTVEKIRSLARKLKRKKKLDIIFIDYLQLIQPSSKGGYNKNDEVSDITRKLKILAKDLDVPVVVLSQLSRSVESRDNKRPVMSDLRDSGSIEQDADIVSFLYRHEYYLQQRIRMDRKPDPNLEDEMLRCRNKATLIIAKVRRGSTGDVDLQWHGETTTFYDEEAK